MNKTEIIVREDNTIYAELDFIDFLKLKLDIVKGIINEQLYIRNNFGGIDKIDKYGNSDYNYFEIVDVLYREIINAQCKLRKDESSKNN